MPCHHALAEALRAFIDAAGIAEDRKGWLFRTARGHKADTLSELAMNQSDAWCMIRRRAAAAGIAAEIGCHTFRATGITAYLANGGARQPAHDEALRPYQGTAHARRGGAHPALACRRYFCVRYVSRTSPCNRPRRNLVKPPPSSPQLSRQSTSGAQQPKRGNSMKRSFSVFPMVLSLLFLPTRSMRVDARDNTQSPA